MAADMVGDTVDNRSTFVAYSIPVVVRLFLDLTIYCSIGSQVLAICMMHLVSITYIIYASIDS